MLAAPTNSNDRRNIARVIALSILVVSPISCNESPDLNKYEIHQPIVLYRSGVRPYPESQKIRSVDEFGYENWHLNGGLSTRYFSKKQNGKTFFFYCSMGKDSRGNIDGVCSDIDFLSDGNSVSFNFPYHLHGDLPRIEAGIDNLMKSFNHGHPWRPVPRWSARADGPRPGASLDAEGSGTGVRPGSV